MHYCKREIKFISFREPFSHVEQSVNLALVFHESQLVYLLFCFIFSLSIEIEGGDRCGRVRVYENWRWIE